ncbi:hypothetical protein ACFQ07_02765 [Actinomadura adrarensis]|uniref:Uncharacterized protein n=1 Tax=Actinomadura adrarensis TaxID=1819600 RepID=A0ABW3C9G0_9ACTN
MHRNATVGIAQAGALLFGGVTYQMMEAAFRPPAPARRPWADVVRRAAAAHRVEAR